MGVLGKATIMVNSSWPHVWFHSSLQTQISHQPLLLDLLLCFSISYNSTVLEQHWCNAVQSNTSVLPTYPYIFDIAIHFHSAAVALYVYVTVEEYLNSLWLSSYPFQSRYYHIVLQGEIAFWLILILVLFTCGLTQIRVKYKDTCVSNKMQVIKKRSLKKFKAPRLEVVNLCQPHCWVSMLFVFFYLIWEVMFGFYDNFSSVWACSFHECPQVLQWQPRSLKAFRARGIKTQSALLKVPASNLAKYSHTSLIGYNGRILGAFNRPTSGVRSLCFPGHSLFITTSNFPSIFGIRQRNHPSISCSQYFQETCSIMIHTERERRAKSRLQLKTNEWKVIICDMYHEMFHWDVIQRQ